MAGTVRTLEDLVAFGKARQLARTVSAVCAHGPLQRDYVIRNQMRRAALSVVTNVAEGFERDGNREFLNFLSIAKGSAGEIRAHAYVALDAHLISETECQALATASKDFCSVAGGLMKYLRSAPVTGIKWKEDPSSHKRVSESRQPYADAIDPLEDVLEIPAEQFGLPKSEVPA